MTDVDSVVTGVLGCRISTQEIAMGANAYMDNAVSHLQIPHASGVYMITDKLTGARYIGSSKDMRHRASIHFSALKTHKDDSAPVYSMFRETYDVLGAKGFDVVTLIMCAPEHLLEYEAICIAALGNTINRYKRSDDAEVYTDSECKNKSARVKALWATPEYRAKAIAARKGNAYNKGYKCTPEQIENRKKAGRISNTKRKYGVTWKVEYARLYPEFVSDLNDY